MYLHKKRVAVLRGGEMHRFQSLKTGAFVLSNMPAYYEGLDVLVDKSGWHLGGKVFSPIKILNQADVVFSALHDNFGGGGGLQNFLKSHGIRHTSSSVMSSNFSLNKDFTKNILNRYGFKTPQHLVIRKGDFGRKEIKEIFSSLSHPIILKPSSSGFSHMVFKVFTLADLEDAISKIFEIYDKAIVEEFIEGREIGVGFLENFRGQKIYHLPAMEIRKGNHSDIFTEENKYLNDLCYEHSFLTGQEKEIIKNLTLDIQRIFNLKSYGSIDIILHPKRGPYILETNTSPGLDTHSPFIKSLEIFGITPDLFLHNVIENAMKNGLEK